MSDQSSEARGSLDPEFERELGELRGAFQALQLPLAGAKNDADPSALLCLAYAYLEELETLEKCALAATDHLRKEALRRLKYQSGTVALDIAGVDAPRQISVTVLENAAQPAPEDAAGDDRMPKLEQVIIRLDRSGWTTEVGG